MAPKKKTSIMKWVRKSQQSAKIAEPVTENKTSSIMSDLSLLADSVSELHLSSSPSQLATKESVPDWSLLPEELLHIISENLEDCFDVIHARSVCRPWRSILPFPSWLLRTRYSLPSFARLPRKSKGFCTLEKFPMFLVRVRAPASASTYEYYLGGIDQDKSEDHMELPSPPIQCTVKVKIGESDPTLMNILDCQIFSLGYQYRMVGWDPESLSRKFRAVAFLPLNREGGGGGFVVLLGYYRDLFVLTSAEMRWIRLERISTAVCSDIVTFRGRFYVDFLNGDTFVFDPYCLEATPLMPSEISNCGSVNYLVPSGNDELYLVEVIIPRNTDVLDFSRLTLRVSRLDEEAGEWVEVTDLGDRVLFIGQPGNVSCSAKELPDGCGLSGDSVLMTYEPWKVTHPYRYGVQTGREEDELNCWRFSTENRVTILGTSPVVALQVER
ncbi:hypothetical protein EUTSA_v10000166mg [Eutrema salsugineum]|uniref:F-box domain-containing protein n=1 Tax=Eutrema salsugineum TaxID=72664 RepID=V4M2Q7_EUTSA|nr:F-box/kelch-repeat protein At1g64840 [Eutrema salsugineum]ESQ46478.1 hypothetical protein EUTSA_v10000166mg [Eutrema salsugineum]